MAQIAILLATYNSELFLREQLFSLQNQTYQDWRLYVLNDGSSDGTLEILNEFKAKWGDAKIDIRSHSNRGCTFSFLNLVSDIHIKADYYAYCDHDDIWQADKLEKAIQVLESKRQDIPQLYCSAAELIDKKGKVMGHSALCRQPPCFQNAIVQNIASGNTMVFNRAAKELLALVGVVNVPIHDWWTYILVTACGGQVHYDTRSFIQYRQHEGNLVGYGQSFKAQIKRLFKKNAYQFHLWNEAHIRYLNDIKNRLSANAINTLQAFEKSRSGNMFNRFYWLHKSGVFGQTWARTLKLYIACFLNKI